MYSGVLFFDSERFILPEKIIPMWLVGLAREEVKFCCTVQSGSALDQVWLKD